MIVFIVISSPMDSSTARDDGMMGEHILDEITSKDDEAMVDVSINHGIITHDPCLHCE